MAAYRLRGAGGWPFWGSFKNRTFWSEVAVSCLVAFTTRATDMLISANWGLGLSRDPGSMRHRVVTHQAASMARASARGAGFS